MMRILETNSFSVDKKVTRIGLKLTGKNVDQGAFPGTVFAQKSMDLARLHEEIHTFQRLRVAEAFTDAANRNDGRGAHLTDCAKAGQAVGLVLLRANRLSKSQHNR